MPRPEFELAIKVRNADPTDQSAVAGVGAAIEQWMCAASAKRADVAEAILAALGALQRVYLGDFPSPNDVMTAVADVIAAADLCLANDPAADCMSALTAAVGGLREAIFKASSRDEGPVPTLDDILARLMGIEAGDTKEIEAIGKDLDRVIKTGFAAASAMEHAQAARKWIEKIRCGEAADAAVAMSEIGAELEMCQKAQDAPETKSDPAISRKEAATVEAEAPREAERATGVEPAAQPAAILPEDTDVSLLKEFVVECLEHIRNAESSLLTLEADPTHEESVHTIFRAFHTIKGTSGFLGLHGVQKLSHRAENLLDRARNGEIKLTGGYADLAFESCDMLKTMIKGLEVAVPGGPLAVPELYESLMAKLENPEAAGINDEAAVVSPAVPRLGDLLVASGKADRKAVEEAASAQGDGKIGEAFVQKGVASAADVAQSLRAQKQMTGGESSVRVGTERLDALINMIGELVISHSMIAQDPQVVDGDNPRLSKNAAHAGKIVRELQDLTMSLRMVPLKQTFQKMARLVRDLGRKSGKSVQFVTEGDDTEIDRNMVESLNDPLVHMIRNAMDHGIETAEVRRAAGKPETATVSLRAYHSAGSVVIELRDDGKGIDKERIRAKAIERGLVEAGRELSESETFALMFLPGFSTAEKITDVSGRGVGMDVVKRNVESLRGRVDVSSRPGEGSTFTVRLPLTMAIADAMLIRVGEERYLLPTVTIEQSFRPSRESITTVSGKGEVIMLRNALVPVVRLHKIFNVPGAATELCNALLIAVEAEGRRCALMADELLGQHQVVIKSLGRAFNNTPGVSGAAILGDGRVGLILDAGGLLKLSDNAIPEKTIQAATPEAVN